MSITPKSILIEYENGEQKGIELGRRFGSASGLTVPHEIVTDLKPGQKFKPGAAIAYNKGFFERDIINPDNVVWKIGVTVKAALYESIQTHEDASSISQRLSNLLSTKLTKIKNVILDFNQEVRDIVKVNQEVKYETILCMIEDVTTANNSKLFDSNTLDTLRLLGNLSPSAKTTGVIEKIEVFYHGEKEDMSNSLRELAETSDKQFKILATSLGKKYFSGKVDEGFRNEGQPLLLDKACIRFYITKELPSGVGDKGVVANQLKTVFSEVMTNKIKSQQGEEIDLIFGQKSIDDRIVNSGPIIGTTNTLMKLISKEAAKIYRSKQ